MSPRYKENEWTVYPRSMPGGKTIFYYYVYDKDGNRVSRSTGIGFTRKRDEVKKRKEAEAYVKKKYEAGKIAASTDDKTLSQFVESRHFFDWYRSDYVRSKLARSNKGHEKITERYIIDGGKVWKNRIEPYHGDLIINQITPEDCDDLLFRWVDTGSSHKTANNYRSYYSIIMREAKRLGIIKVNPWDNVEGLAIDPEKKGAFAIGEVKKLIDQAAKDEDRDRIYYYAVKLAFFTGLRISEIVGLKTDDVIDKKIEKDDEVYHYSYLRVERQYNIKLKKLTPLKDKDPRDVPIVPQLREDLQQFLTGKDRFIFSFHPEQKTPITHNRLREWLYEQMDALGIPRTDESGNRKTFHSTRRFLNTLLKLNQVDGSIIRRFTGHDSEQMTEHYTDYLPEELTAISAAQSKLIEDKKKIP